MPSVKYGDAMRIEDYGRITEIPWGCCALCYKAPHLGCPYAVISKSEMIVYGKYIGRRDKNDMFELNGRVMAVKNLALSTCIGPPAKGNVDLSSILAMYATWKYNECLLFARLENGSLRGLTMRKGHLYTDSKDNATSKLPADAIVLTPETVSRMELPLNISIVVFTWLYFNDTKN